MLKKLFMGKSVMKRITLIVLFMTVYGMAVSQDGCVLRGETDSTYLQRLKLVPGVQISAAPGRFNGYVEYLPPDYNAPGNTKEYGVILFFHGLSGMAAGNTKAQLCRIIVDSWQTVLGLADGQYPGRRLPDSLLNNFIIISPQYQFYNYDSTIANFPSARNVEDAINWVENMYRVNSDAIVLTGLSSGANMILDYAASSVERAQRVAAINVISTCARIGRYPHAQDAYLNLANAGTPSWFVACSMDSTCDYQEHSQLWVDMINSTNPVEPPVYSLFTSTAEPAQCGSTNNHNAWNYFYNPNNTINGTTLYDWMLVQTALPVKLSGYDVRLVKDRVLVSWTTASETNNASFSIERAGDDQNFSVIGTVAGNLNSASEKNYSFTDNNPLSGISFYRLVQTDVDGKQTRFEIKRIIHTPGVTQKLIVSPNPFGDNLTAFITLNRQQKVSAYITDMGGRRLVSQTAVYGEGSREIRLNTSALPKGMYFLKIEGENFSDVQKVIRR